VLVGGVLLALVAGGAAHLIFGAGGEWQGLWAAVTIALAPVIIALAVLSARRQ
jgi:fumarate reductase subunit D